MNSKERVIAAINHQEPDRIPLDIGAGKACKVHILAYKKLLDYLGLQEGLQLSNLTAQLAYVSEQVYQKLGVDLRPVSMKPKPADYERATELDDIKEGKDYYWYEDEWGRNWRRPKEDGLYYDMAKFPLAKMELAEYAWPDPTADYRFEVLKDNIVKRKENGDYPLVFNSPLGNGFLQMGAQLFGFDKWFMMLALEPKKVEAFLDRFLELKISYWDRLLEEIGDELDIACEADDLGTQKATWMSVDMYRRYIKPRQEKLFGFIKKKADVKVFLHSCGSVYDFIPDLIEAGVDILNPIQISAAKMDPATLKKEFGQDLVFWGGGVDTQKVLPYGSKQEIEENVKRNIDSLAPGGGFVFATVHNIQADVPPQNIITMLETLQKYGQY